MAANVILRGMKFFFFICCHMWPMFVTTAPLQLHQKELMYLTQFGYLPPEDPNVGNLIANDRLKEAIKNLQKNGNIPVTGKMDESTKKLVSTPRCGVADISISRHRRFALHGQRWLRTNLTWSLRSRPNLDVDTVRRELAAALGIWSRHSRLTFKEAPMDHGDADILIYFERGYHGDGFPFDGVGQVLAHAFFPGPGRGGDAHFDEQETWLLNNRDITAEGVSLLAVAAHEFGHSLGLAHSSVPDALMYPWYQGLSENFQLPEDDRNAVQILYGMERSQHKGRNRNDFSTEHSPSRSSTIKYPPLFYPSTKPTTTTATTATGTATTTATPPLKQPKIRENPPPVTCHTSYDAISVIRRDIFIFKDKYNWRIGDKGLYPGYPSLIERLWTQLPRNFSHVDAVYERPDGQIIFFLGKEIYAFHGNILLDGYPKPLTWLGLPESVDRIDAAFIWGHNSRTYLMSGVLYWRLDEGAQQVEPDYPRDVAIWDGVGQDVDAAFQDKNGVTYFFKGEGFWQFDDIKMRVKSKRQRLSATHWMGCPKNLKDESNVNGEKISRIYKTNGEIVIAPSISFIIIVTYCFIGYALL